MDSNKVHAQPEQGLTEEQVEKASITLWQIFGMVRHQTWGDLAEGSKEVYRERTKIFAPYLQFTPAQLPGDVIEGMKLAWRNAGCGGTVVSDSNERMTAAAQVLLDKVCTEVANEFMDSYHFSRARAVEFTDKIRYSLLKPAEPTLDPELEKLMRHNGINPYSERGKILIDYFTRRTSGGTKCDCHLRRNQVCNVCQKSGMKERP